MGRLNNTALPYADLYSSFTIVEKTLSKIVEKLMTNQRLMKLLYYTDRHADSAPNLNQEQIASMLGKQIKIVPKLQAENESNPYIIISFSNFIPQTNMTSFREVVFGIDIICPYDIWMLDDFKLRPYRIAGEIDATINHSTVLKGGIADFASAKPLLLTPQLGGVSLYYTLTTESDDLTRHYD